MGRLLDILNAYLNLILFIVLQTISLILIFKYNDNQRIFFDESINEFSGGIQSINQRWKAYFYLGERNEILVEENRKLYEETIKLKLDINTYKYRVPYTHNYTTIPDSLLPKTNYQFISTRVNQNSVRGNFNYIIIEGGKNQGVTKSMGVISTDGIVGLVATVSDNYSVVLSVLNKKSKFSVEILNKDIQGTLLWEGIGGQASMEYVPVHYEIYVGDTVITSHLSTTFPEGFIVGIIESIDPHKKQDGFYDIKVKLKTDFNKLNYVYLIKNKGRDEFEKLVKPFTEKLNE